MARLRTVVLVEEKPLEALAIQRACRDLADPWTLVHCCDGLAALTYLQRPKDECPALLLVDADNRAADTEALLAWLRHDGHGVHLPVAFLVTAAAGSDPALWQRLGPGDRLIVPAAFDLFGREVRQYITSWIARATAAA